ncbi:sensor histidine kinase ResE [Shouchella clausii]|uniref:histidine kinase n=2 Tax=Shouchella TaxID=2893057 RepID=A0A268P4H3_SHOCL|nr:ATP-binding protein [Psychrobacillus sp. MER TA 17]PAD18125.1 PAS domain-containing sensor histidine kinase [Shouchella clausii]PAD48603.1 PAS domain-containing sensor histidine kinase [Shouchella clausii]PAE90642.1 PAS domain-containing sensor histidine kinase [Shouchella clausii]PAF11029.1 PAS domain-containing sensor histidine kinase [Shouchella clausii]
MMLWQSVVGKLWFTILLLVTAVLTILMVLLLRFTEGNAIEEAESRLNSYANMAKTMYETHTDETSTYDYLQSLSNEFQINITIIKNGAKAWSAQGNRSGEINVATLLEEWSVEGLEKGERIVTEANYPASGQEQDPIEMIVVGVPLSEDYLTSSGIILYQPLSAVEEAAAETRRIIYLSAGIALVLTTVFAFFLSSRITAPLRKMRQAALEVAQGQFHTKVPILTQDEIGQLAIAFNRMRRELNRNISELNQEKEQLSHILASMADGVITLDRQGRILLTNPQAEEVLALLFYEEGQKPITGERKTLPVSLTPLFEQVVSAEKEELQELSVQGRSMAVLMAPLYAEEHVRGAVAVVRDVTEERRHDKLRKDFIANVSHELRTPISMLQGYSEAMVDGVTSSDEERKEVAQIIYDESLRMGRLVNELLDLARMEAGYIDLNLEEVDLDSYLERITRKFASFAREYDVTVELAKPGRGQIAVFDPDRIEQVLTNLIHNAIRHTNPGGLITVVHEQEEERDTFAVVDTGRGIPEEDLPYVFERFYKADKARTRQHGGTGLGLAIAKHIIDAHQGKITVHSRLGEGTTFRFTLPKQQGDKGK